MSDISEVIQRRFKTSLQYRIDRLCRLQSSQRNNDDIAHSYCQPKPPQFVTDSSFCTHKLYPSLTEEIYIQKIQLH